MTAEAPVTPIAPSSDSLPLVSVYVAAKEGKDETLSAIIEIFNSLPDFQDKFSLYQVESSYILPYLVQKAVAEKSADVILAVSVTVGVADSALTSTLVSQTIQLGVSSGIPVVPAVVQSASVSALKASLPEQVASWAQAVKDLLVPLVPITSRSAPAASIVEEVTYLFISYITMSCTDIGYFDSFFDLNRRMSRASLPSPRPWLLPTLLRPDSARTCRM